MAGENGLPSVNVYTETPGATASFEWFLFLLADGKVRLYVGGCAPKGGVACVRSRAGEGARIAFDDAKVKSSSDGDYQLIELKSGDSGVGQPAAEWRREMNGRGSAAIWALSPAWVPEDVFVRVDQPQADLQTAVARLSEPAGVAATQRNLLLSGAVLGPAAAAPFGCSPPAGPAGRCRGAAPVRRGSQPLSPFGQGWTTSRQRRSLSLLPHPILERPRRQLPRHGGHRRSGLRSSGPRRSRLRRSGGHRAHLLPSEGVVWGRLPKG